jgi:hypothetical protein
MLEDRIPSAAPATRRQGQMSKKILVGLVAAVCISGAAACTKSEETKPATPPPAAQNTPPPKPVGEAAKPPAGEAAKPVTPPDAGKPATPPPAPKPDGEKPAAPKPDSDADQT